jgi:GT2 family glycosyltransferase
MLRVGVVIVNYNGGEDIVRCLESVEASTFRPAATVVVDNASDDGSADEVAKRFPAVVLVRNSLNGGFAAGVNAGIGWCMAERLDAVLLLNPDAVLERAALDRLVAAAGRHPRQILAPAICYLERPDLIDSYVGDIVWWRGRTTAPFLGRRLAGDAATERRFGTASGCALWLPRSVVERLGELSQEYFLYFEDADYIERAAQAGFGLWYVPAAVVFHKEGASTGGPGSPLATYYYIRNRHIFVRKFRGRDAVYVGFLAYSALDVAARAIRSFTAGNTPLARAILRGALDGWRGSVGPDRAPIRLERSA